MTEKEVQSEYKDDDLVYVDVKAKKVIGLVQWLPSGKPKQIEVVYTQEILPPTDDKKPESKDAERPPRPSRPRKKRYYPWCSYKTAKKVYQVEGKCIDKHGNADFDSTFEKALKEPYWD